MPPRAHPPDLPPLTVAMWDFSYLVRRQGSEIEYLDWGTAIHRALGPPVWRRWREAWLQRLARRLDTWADWAGERALPLVTTEGWGPINYDDAPESPDGAEWDWVKDICAEGLAMARDRGWRGVCTSNFCQPHFPGMWRDRAWHRRVTEGVTSS